MSTLLVCDGLVQSNIVVPPFEVGTDELVCLVDSTPESDRRGPNDWLEIMRHLSGKTNSPAVRQFGSPGMVWNFESSHVGSVAEIIEKEGVGIEPAKAILSSLGIQPTSPFNGIGLTERLLLLLRMEREQSCTLVVFSTSGLDPSGFSKVMQEVLANLAICSAIHLTSKRLFDFDAAPERYSRVIQTRLRRGEQ